MAIKRSPYEDVNQFVRDYTGTPNQAPYKYADSFGGYGSKDLAKSRAGVSQVSKTLASLRAQAAASDRRIEALLNSINSQPRPAVPNFAAINATARKRAAKAVNPFYQKELKTFLQKQTLNKKRAKNDYQRNIKDLQEALDTTLETSEIGRERTAEDVATNLGEIANTEDVFQTQEGQGFDQARQALAGELAQSNLTGSGLGAQQEARAIDQRNFETKQQTRSFNVQKEAQNLFKTRTFADLARSDTLATSETAKKKKYAKIDIDRYVKDLATETKSGKRSFEQQRLAALAQEEDRQRSLQFRRFLKSIGDPGVLSATASTYGSMF